MNDSSSHSRQTRHLRTDSAESLRRPSTIPPSNGNLLRVVAAASSAGPEPRQPRRVDHRAKSLPNEPANLQNELADHLLGLHGQELIDQLQRWGETLDAREANLNAREATFELRQRQFRVQRQQWMEEKAEQQRKLDRIRQQVEAHTRRLAFDLS